MVSISLDYQLMKRISEHGPDRGVGGGGGVRGGGAGARAARRLPPVRRQLRTQAQDTRVEQVGGKYPGMQNLGTQNPGR